MAFYSVEVWDKAFYPVIAADSPEQAEQIALEWFIERNPATKVKVLNCSDCIHNGDLTLEDVAICNCCEKYNFYEPREEN